MVAVTSRMRLQKSPVAAAVEQLTDALGFLARPSNATDFAIAPDNLYFVLSAGTILIGPDRDRYDFPELSTESATASKDSYVYADLATCGYLVIETALGAGQPTVHDTLIPLWKLVADATDITSTTWIGEAEGGLGFTGGGIDGTLTAGRVPVALDTDTLTDFAGFTYVSDVLTVASGLVVTAAGTASAPAICMGDTNSGLFGGADVVAISTGGVERLTVSTTAVTSTLPLLMNNSTRIAIGVTGQSITVGGSHSIAIGSDTNVSSNGSIAVGFGAIATGEYIVSILGSCSGSQSVCIGYASTCNTNAAVVIGQQASNSGGAYGISIGTLSSVTSDAIALGTGSTATGFGAVAIGRNSSAPAKTVCIGTPPSVSASYNTTNLYLGGAVTDTGTLTSFTIQPVGGSGTDKAGANLIIAGAKGTGAGAPGNVLFQTASVLGTGTTLQTLTTRVTVSETLVTSTLPLVLPAGTASAPAQYFSGDPNTGPYSVGADQYGISAGGTLRVSVSTTAFDCDVPIDLVTVAASASILVANATSDTPTVVWDGAGTVFPSTAPSGFLKVTAGGNARYVPFWA